MSTIGSSDIDGSVQFLVVNQDPSSFPVDCSVGSVVIYNDLWYRKLDDGPSTNFTTTSFSGASGMSGFSGASGVSGYSGGSGVSGFSAPSGVSGFSATAIPTSPAGGSFSGSFPSPGLAPDSVTASILADGAVSTKKYGAESIPNSALGIACITSEKIKNGGIDTHCFADGSIYSRLRQINGRRHNFEFTSTKIEDGSVTSGEFADGSLRNEHLAPNAITRVSNLKNAKIEDGCFGGDILLSIDNRMIKDGGITKEVIDIVHDNCLMDFSITTQKILAVISEEAFKDGSIYGEKIKDKAATENKIDLVNGEKIKDGCIDQDLIADQTLFDNVFLSLDADMLHDNCINSLVVKLLEVTGEKINTLAITKEKRMGASGTINILGNPNNFTAVFENGILSSFSEEGS